MGGFFLGGGVGVGGLGKDLFGKSLRLGFWYKLGKKIGGGVGVKSLRLSVS